jgi:hypothetical protein
MTDHKDGAAGSPLQIQQKPVRGRPFEKGQSGNPAGKPKGTRNRATVMAEALLNGNAEALANKAVELALDGDVTALRLCLDRSIPRRRDRVVQFELPPIRCAADAVTAYDAVMTAVADGTLTPAEAAEFARLIEGTVHAIEVADVELVVRMRTIEDLRAGGHLRSDPDKPIDRRE